MVNFGNFCNIRKLGTKLYGKIKMVNYGLLYLRY